MMVDFFNAPRPAFLGSVASVSDAETALAGGVDLIDCKDPEAGALGALELATIRQIVSAVGGRQPVSATTGDLPSVADLVVPAGKVIAASGVDVIKVGFFGDGDAVATANALGSADFGRASLFAVLMADRPFDAALVPALARAGFRGVMLDTADKDGRSLIDKMPVADIAAFVEQARLSNLVVGLAGSVKLADIPRLAPLRPDILGFRGALCATERRGPIDKTRVCEVRAALTRARDLFPLANATAA